MPPESFAIETDDSCGQKRVTVSAQGLQLSTGFPWRVRLAEDLASMFQNLIRAEHEAAGMPLGDAPRFHFRQRIRNIAGRGIFGLQRRTRRLLVDPGRVHQDVEPGATQQIRPRGRG